jgi:carbamoyl-phosphate synthase large subunit
MGIDEDLGLAYAKSQMAAQPPLPSSGNVFLSVKDSDKRSLTKLATELVELGFKCFATSGTATALAAAGIKVNRLFKLAEGRPHVLDMMKNDQIDLIINTPSGKTPRKDEIRIRSLAVANRIPTLTTISAVEASIRAIRSFRIKGITVKSLQEYQEVPSSGFRVAGSEPPILHAGTSEPGTRNPEPEIRNAEPGT